MIPSGRFLPVPRSRTRMASTPFWPASTFSTLLGGRGLGLGLGLGLGVVGRGGVRRAGVGCLCARLGGDQQCRQRESPLHTRRRGRLAATTSKASVTATPGSGIEPRPPTRQPEPPPCCTRKVCGAL